AGRPAPHQRLGVIRIGLEPLVDDRGGVRECRLVAREGAKHDVADLIVEPLLLREAGGRKAYGERSQKKQAPPHGGSPEQGYPYQQSTLYHRVSAEARPRFAER